MTKVAPASSPEQYVSSLSGWKRSYVEALRVAVLATANFVEVIKWGLLVYFSNGPVLLIRAEDQRVLFGFWRGQRLRDVEPRLKGGGKYEMATLELVEGTPLERQTVSTLVERAVGLNVQLGDPTAVGRPSTQRAA